MKSSLLNLARGTVVYGLGEVLSRFITFLLLPAFTAYLSPAEYGVISILSALGLLLSPVFSLGLGAAIAPLYFEGNSRERKDTMICTTFLLLLASAATLMIGGWLLAGEISRVLFQTPEYAALVRISLATIAFAFLTTPFRQRLQFEERSKSYVVLSTVSILLSTGLSVLMVIGLRRGMRGMLEAGLLAQAIGFALFAWPSVREVRPGVSAAIARELLRLSLPLIPAFGSLFLLQQGSKYLLQWLAGLDQVGLYSVGLNLGSAISLLVTGFQSAWIPYFMSFADRREEAQRVFGRVLTYYVFLVGALSLSLFAIAKPLMMVMTQPAFHASWRVVGLGGTAQLMAGAFSILLPGMYLAKEVQFTGLIQGVAAVAGIAFNLLLIPHFGMVGAALSLVLSYLVLDVLQCMWSRYRGYISVDYEWKRLARFACIYVVYAVAASWQRNLSVLLECGVAAGLLAILPAIMYVQLSVGERRELWSYVGRLTGAGPAEKPAEA